MKRTHESHESRTLVTGPANFLVAFPMFSEHLLTSHTRELEIRSVRKLVDCSALEVAEGRRMTFAHMAESIARPLTSERVIHIKPQAAACSCGEEKTRSLPCRLE